MLLMPAFSICPAVAGQLAANRAFHGLLHGLARSLRASGQTLVLASFPPTDDAGKALVLDAEQQAKVTGAVKGVSFTQIPDVMAGQPPVTLGPCSPCLTARRWTAWERASLFPSPRLRSAWGR